MSVNINQLVAQINAEIQKEDPGLSVEEILLKNDSIKIARTKHCRYVKVNGNWIKKCS